MANAKNLQICVDRIIPDELAAIPTGRGGVLFRHDFAPKDLRLAVAARKKWPNGSVLNCRFLDGTSLQQQHVQQFAKLWEEFANIRFNFGSEKHAQIRVSFQHDPTAWSAVGTDALNRDEFHSGEPTMNFGWLKDDTNAALWRGTVLHEFGHALGAIHEHQQPAASLVWDRSRVVELFSGPPNNWSEEQIEHNIFERYSREQANWTEFDPHSIMLYHFPGELFSDGVGTVLNTQLSEMDKAFIAMLYPGRKPADPS